MENLAKTIGIILGSLAVILFVAVLLALPVQLLWNGCLLDAVDGTHPITFLQALGLNFLFSILFKATSTSNSKN
jgi:hypothetical protein